jgi:hypothetical protein
VFCGAALAAARRAGDEDRVRERGATGELADGGVYCAPHRDFAEAAERLDQWGDGVFASFGLGPDEIAELRKRFAAWPRP